MKCWRCGQEINDGTQECVYCHADQRRSVPTTDVGQALRQLYDHYGADAVLSNNVLLTNGLGDVVSDALGTNVKKVKSQIRMGMDAGLGRLYKEQLAVGKPDDQFYSRAKVLLTEDAGLNEKSADEIIAFFDEMIGWSDSGQPSESGNPNKEQEDAYQRAFRKMDNRSDLEDALFLLEALTGYRNADQLAQQCRDRIMELSKEEASQQGLSQMNSSQEKSSHKKAPTNAPVSQAGRKTFIPTKTDHLYFDIKNGELKRYKGNASNVTIPESVTSIGKSAFNDCNSLISVTIPDSVTSIGGWAFNGCKSLTSVTIPNSVTAIGKYAFYGCSGLTSVTIPNSVTSIGEKAFYYCSNLTSVTIPNSVISIGNSAFGFSTIIRVPKNSYAEQWCKDNCKNYTTYEKNT